MTDPAWWISEPGLLRNCPVSTVSFPHLNGFWGEAVGPRCPCRLWTPGGSQPKGWVPGHLAQSQEGPQLVGSISQQISGGQEGWGKCDPTALPSLQKHQWSARTYRLKFGSLLWLGEVRGPWRDKGCPPVLCAAQVQAL